MNKHLDKLIRAACAVALVGLVTGCAGTQGGGAQAPSGGSGNVPRTDFDRTDADRRAGVRLELASGYFAGGQYGTALNEVKQVLSIKPDMPEALTLRGLIYAALGETGLADESFKRSLALAPRDPDTLHNYGWFLCQLKRWGEASSQFEQALAQPQYRGPARSWLAKGVCEARALQMAEAERSLGKAFELEPGNPAVQVNLAEVLLRNGQAERARFYIKRVNGNPEQSNAQSLWLALKIERRLNNSSAVTELAQELRKRFPQSPETLALDNGRFDD
ncbi:type IV pilus biogenesis/stability protein PilW [Pelomonas sp. SE-A7]|uniref:type IV pilus biogenesis/stability protein PilW n=1 Tax=Pelomonas sp. SE-A7 TaxID=3054953 RepID=UPI00259C87BE|nr:type IV pilus biogenesis/stability protein PilW [Pelomonas sp. SE-A7]MDM4767392.1 type IV pilus biogenesis/stability protein PilW [Pelomonas sp. SE-A7]